jgi:glycosyltransferase involved in cell wall biosynthesis
MGSGELLNEFAMFSVQVDVGPANSSDAEYLLRYLKARFNLKAVILNSAETSAFASAALYVGTPSVALIHEFAEYTVPPGKASAMIATVDRVVVPAKLVFESVQREVATHFGAPANNIVVRPQGCLPSLPPHHQDRPLADLNREEILALLKGTGEKKPPIVLGAGFVHMRKGIELFVQAAHEVRKRVPDVKFVWVGDGYLPRADMGYSVWLAETVRQLELDDTVFFLPMQAQLDTLFELSNAFFLSSRLDPFPSVVLDALEAGKQVVCFERATGAAELLQSGKARGAVVEYANIPAAATALVDIIKSPPEEAARINRSLVAEQFRYSDYAAFIGEQIAEAQTARTKANNAVERILSSQSFDSRFYSSRMIFPFNNDRPCRDYVAQGVKGLSKFNPRPGFNDGLYRHGAKIDADEVPLDHALRHSGQAMPATHSCIWLDTMSPRPLASLRVALHLHLFYPELANDFFGRLATLACPIDLFITTTDQARQAELESVFSAYAHGRVTYFQVPNRGRNIGPLLTLLEAPLAAGDYDVVGHLHGKRSLAVDAAMGDRWRTYLLDTLLASTFSSLLGLFADDDKLGLVFAEDRHAAGWNDNYEIARGLARRVQPPLELPAYPYFPLGTMFWARRAALAPLWRMELRTEDLPPEPLPYDGTVLHALERILPACCEAAGFAWRTVYDRRVVAW